MTKSSYSNILLPLDGSDHSKLACAMAYRLAEAIPGEETMHLIHCVEPIPPRISGPNRQKLIEDYKREADEFFRPCVELFAGLGNPCHTYVRYGEPGLTIAQAAEDLSCDLIIMGCRGQGGLMSLVFGSVSTHVAKHSKVPVILAKAGPGDLDI